MNDVEREALRAIVKALQTVEPERRREFMEGVLFAFEIEDEKRAKRARKGR